ncbi:hypothetical protein DPMN_067586 [Dreissena polymorpha]|uniref:Uncharacterized protein n=1 Tax=Dreissena polymorpha TaxID=45954 RepID=A0A9D3Z0J6_DREPO|nr:hypothetical protein DPMN_067586 [Dreissena polymorpha]
MSAEGRPGEMNTDPWGLNGTTVKKRISLDCIVRGQPPSTTQIQVHSGRRLTTERRASRPIVFIQTDATDQRRQKNIQFVLKTWYIDGNPYQLATSGDEN